MAGVVNYTAAPSLFHAWGTAWISRKVPKTFTSNNSLAMSTGTHSTMVNNAIPALLTVEHQGIIYC